MEETPRRIILGRHQSCCEENISPHVVSVPSRAKQRRNGSIETVARGAPQVFSPDHWNVLSTVPIATLDHLREGENLRCILPLPQPASHSVAEIALCNLVETTQHVYRVQSPLDGSRAKSFGMVGCGRRQLHVPERWHKHAESKKRSISVQLMQANVDLASNLKRIRLDYHGEDHGQFLAMEILDGNLLVTVSIKNLTSAFNLIELSDPWMPFQALGKPVPGALAIPQIRKDRPFPAGHSQDGNQDYGRIVSICLDGFTEFELKHCDDLVIGSCGQLQAVMQEAYKQWNVPRQVAKALPRQVAIEDLGCHIDGVFGAVSMPRQFDVSLGAAPFWLLSQNRPQHMDLQIIAGCKCRNFQYRRETSSVFHVVWFALGRQQPQHATRCRIPCGLSWKARTCPHAHAVHDHGPSLANKRHCRCYRCVCMWTGCVPHSRLCSDRKARSHTP